VPGAHPGAPQGLGDVLLPPHRYTGQVHLDQRFLHRAPAPPIALDDRRLERLPAQLRNLQRHRAGLGLQLAIVAPRALVAPCRRPLIASRIAQPIRLGFQHRVQRLLDRAPDDMAEMLTHPLVVDPDHVA
jgi:hypothetical protein